MFVLLAVSLPNLTCVFSLSALSQVTKLEAEGIVYFRGSLSSGGYFTESFAVLRRGRLDIYAKKKHYLNHENPLNEKPIELKNYRIETNYRYESLVIYF